MTLEESYEDLMKVFAEVESTDDMKALFTDIFTPAEINDFTIRWKLMNDLIEGKPQRKIASDLRISLCRITRGSKMLKKKEGYVSRLLHDRHDETHR